MSLEKLSREIAAVQQELQQLAAHMSAQDAARQRGELEKLRLALEDCASTVTRTTQHAPPVPLSFFDLLPGRAIERVLRLVSERPHSDTWRKHVSPDDAAALFTLGGPLGNALGAHVDLLELHEGPVSRPFLLTRSGSEASDSGIAVRKEFAGVALRTSAGRTTRLRFVNNPATSGNALPTAPPPPIGTQVTQGDAGDDGLGAFGAALAVDWVGALRAGGNRIVQLELVWVHAHILEPILEEVGGRLQSLSLDRFCSSRSHLRRVATHCKKLRKLALYAMYEHDDELWAAIGPGLNELELSDNSLVYPHHTYTTNFRNNEHVLNKARIYCGSLSRVIVDSPCRTKALGKLLISCGPRLLFVRTSATRILEPMFAAIGSACPNAAFELLGPASLSAIHGLRYRVRSLHVSNCLRTYRLPPPPPHSPTSYIVPMSSHPPVDPLAFCAHVNMLHSLELHRVCAGAAAMLEAIVSQASPPLEHIVVVATTEPPFAIFDALRSGTPLLRSFVMEASNFPDEGFDSFVDNHPKLEILHLRAKEGLSHNAQFANIVRKCARFPVLKELVIRNPILSPSLDHATPMLTSKMIAEMRNACMVLRWRGISVNIMGVDYQR